MIFFEKSWGINTLVELSEIIPDATSIIGYVTTGHYSLARGVGFAIGAISLVQLIELEQQSLRYFA
jgi:ribonuclease P/MRP protein subunit POP1